MVSGINWLMQEIPGFDEFSASVICRYWYDSWNSKIGNKENKTWQSCVWFHIEVSDMPKLLSSFFFFLMKCLRPMYMKQLWWYQKTRPVLSLTVHSWEIQPCWVLLFPKIKWGNGKSHLHYAVLKGLDEIVLMNVLYRLK